MPDQLPPTTHLPRAIPLQNASNLRDLGGWPAGHGRRVAMGRVYRAPALALLSDADLATIAALGLRTVCDFRGEKERAYNPVELPGTVNVSLPISPTVGASLKDLMRTAIGSGDLAPEPIMGVLRQAYVAYALASFEQYRALFELTLDAERLPLLFHCAAGKDRTGFGAALLLTALGVRWEDVLADYLATNRLWRREVAAGLDVPDLVKDTLLTAHAPMLAAAFEAVREEYGSVDNYLDRAIGLDSAARARLIELLVEG